MFADFYNYIILGAVQAVTEFLPISSSGHLILTRDILKINNSTGLAFDAVLQLATTLAILVYFHKDFINLARVFFNFVFRKSVFKKSEAEENNIFMKALIVGTLPAIFFGILLEDLMDSVFRNSLLVAGSLMVGAIIMLFSEYLYENRKMKNELSIKKGFYIGLFQSLALIPGMSRSGMVLAGGFFNNLRREVAVKFAFILAVPVLLGSGFKKMFDIWITSPNQETLAPLFVGAVTSFLIGILVIHYLIKYLKNHSLKVFAYYRILLSLIIALIYFI